MFIHFILNGFSLHSNYKIANKVTIHMGIQGLHSKQAMGYMATQHGYTTTIYVFAVSFPSKDSFISYCIWPPTRPEACLLRKKRTEWRGFEPPTLGVASFYANR